MASIFDSLNGMQVFAAVIASLHWFCAGMHFTWTSTSFPKLTQADSPIPITTNEEKWLIILTYLCGGVGAFVIYHVERHIGRKPCISAICVTYACSWLFIALAHNYWFLLIGRIFNGVSDSANFVITPMYIGEIAHEKCRGVLLALMAVFIMLGQIVTTAIGPLVDISTLAYFAASIPTIMFFFSFLIPESPYFYLLHDQRDLARVSITQLRPHGTDVEMELNKVDDAIRTTLTRQFGVRDLFADAVNRKAFFIVCGTRFLLVFCGYASLAFYNESIFLSFEIDINSALCTTLFFLLMSVLTFVSLLIIDYLGRKPVFIWSCALCGVTLLVGGSYEWFAEKLEVELGQWPPLVIMYTFVVVFSLGLGTVPDTLLGEMIPMQVKALSLTLAECFYNLMVCVDAEIFERLFWTRGAGTVFMFYGVVVLTGIPFGIFYMIETKGKTLADISIELRGKSTTFEVAAPDEKSSSKDADPELLKVSEISVL